MLDRELQQRRGELNKLFEDHRTADGEYDLTPEECVEVRRRNGELTTLGQEYDEAKEIASIAERTRRERDAQDDRRGLPHPAPAAGGRQVDARSLGQRFVESRAYREFTGDRGPSAMLEGVELRTLFQTTAGWAPETTRTGHVEMSPTQPVMVAEIVPQTTTNQAAVKYMEETTFTNAAAETAEAGTYPEAALALTERTNTVQKIAVFLPVTDELFEDEQRAQGYVDNRLRFFLRQRLDNQILVGNGTTPNLRGVNNVTGVQTQARGGDPGPDAIYKGIVKVRSVGFTEPSHVVMHPTDWQTQRLLRTADGIYVWGNPSEAGIERIWGKPVVQSTYQTLGTSVVGDFAMFSELSVRSGVEVQVSNSHSTYFIEGKLALRADFRAALIFYRPKAFCLVSGL